MTNDYREKLMAALEFQDYVAYKLYQKGIVINQLCSKRYQNEVGESISGYEIKLDRRFRDTGNLYFEYAEKSNPHNENYVPSGFLRKDNTWLWIIGDYKEVWIIGKRSIQRLYDYCTNERFRQSKGIKFVKQETSMGMCVPIKVINTIAVNYFNFEDDN